MEHISGIENINIEGFSAVTVGKFDGIHRGHGLLTKKLVGYAGKNDLSSVAVTFDISPRLKLNKEDEIGQNIITASERAMLLGKEGVDFLLELEFTEALMTMEPEAFIEMLFEKLNMRYIICGTDFTFGYKGRGDVKLLKKLGEKMGFVTEVIEKIQSEKRDISSTYIREEILAGRIDKANALLGYDYFVYGKVVHGNRIGTKLDMPTINMIPTSDKLLPPKGVYLSRVALKDMMLTGVTNLGMRPTIDEEKKVLSVETHILDFSGDLYDKDVMVEFLRFIRPEKKFAGLKELKEQIKKDIKAARRISEEM